MWSTSRVPVEIQASDSLDGSCDNPCVVLPHLLRFGAGCVIESVVLALFRLHLVPGTSSIAYVSSSCFQVRHPPSLCRFVAIFPLVCPEIFLFHLHVVVADV